MNVLTSTQAAYIAGIIDGEGCISYMSRGVNAGKYPSLRLIVTNTNEELILWLESAVGCGNLYQRKANLKHKGCYTITWNGTIATALLRQVLPYLTIKAQRAKLVVDLAEKVEEALAGRKGFGKALMPGWLAEEKLRVVEALHEANKRGPN